MTVDSARWHQQLAFCDALRNNPELAYAYRRLKHELAQNHQSDREAYSSGKQEFVSYVLRGRTG
jgi:GrpB-like predicted nucleotidyltransferase (UPF0157 family)